MSKRDDQRAVAADAGRIPQRRRRLVLSLWVAALVVAAPLAAQQSHNLSGGGFEDLDSQSAQVHRTVSGGEFAGVRDATLAAVLVPSGRARPGDLPTAIRQVSAKVGSVAGIGITPAAQRAAAASARARPGRPIVIPLDFAGGEREAIDLARKLRPKLGIMDTAGQAAGGTVDVHLAGQGALWAAYQKMADKDLAKAETRGFPIIALVLFVAFGSLAAVALPLTLGAVSVMITGAIIYLLSLQLEMSVFVTSIASMIGIGVAVDYSMFVLVRYREEVGAGRSAGEARAAAMATSGRAVVFSGLTVITSLAALFLIHSNGIQSIAIGAIAVVAISVLASSTLLPVLIDLLGRRTAEPGRVGAFLRRRRRVGAASTQDGFWERWTRAVMQRPRLSLLAATALLLTLAVPAVSLQVQNNASRQLPAQSEASRGLRAAASVLGPGGLGPGLVLIRFDHRIGDGAADRATLARLQAAITRDPGVSRVQPPRLSRDGHAVLLTAIYRSNPESSAARDTVDRLRERLSADAGARAAVAVGGTTAVTLDFDRLSSRSLWRLALFVLAVSFFVLLVLLRSLVLPVKAMLMNALSIAVAYGVLVAVFQWGWLAFLGVHKTTMYPTQPLVLVIAFGLSMDYHVFLLSRIRERYEATGDNRRAVSEALASSATPITSAALIMVAVFLSFVSAGEPSVQQLGVAAAVAIAIDATLVRLVIVPAAMELLGDWNWWLPRPLARILPPLGSPRPAADRGDTYVPLPAASGGPR
jgi:uncharacterized membrane protein YdfJ with MMPL/SSD domain